MAKQMGAGGRYVRGTQRKKGTRQPRPQNHEGQWSHLGLFIFMLAMIGFGIQLASFG